MPRQVGPLLEDADSETLTDAKVLTALLLSVLQRSGPEAMSGEVLWHAAIVYGLHSRVQRSSEVLMFNCLRELLKHEPTHEIAGTVVRERVNPYTGAKIQF